MIIKRWLHFEFESVSNNEKLMILFNEPSFDSISLQIVCWSWNEPKPFLAARGQKSEFLDEYLLSSPESRFLSSECPDNEGLIFDFRLILMFLLRAPPIDKIFCSNFKKIKKLSKFARKERDPIFSLLNLHHLSLGWRLYKLFSKKFVRKFISIWKLKFSARAGLGKKIRLWLIKKNLQKFHRGNFKNSKSAKIIQEDSRHGGFLDGVYKIELDTKTEYEGF